MQRIIIEAQDKETVTLNNISEHAPIFAKREGKFCGMIVKEVPKGWILRLGGESGASGHHETLRACVEQDKKYGYEFFT